MLATDPKEQARARPTAKCAGATSKPPVPARVSPPTTHRIPPGGCEDLQPRDVGATDRPPARAAPAPEPSFFTPQDEPNSPPTKRRGDLYSTCKRADHERRQMWRLTSIVLTIAAASATAGAARAADVTLQVSPETAKLPPAGSAEAVAVVHNPGPKRLLHVVVSVVAPAAVEVEPKRTKPMAIAVGADAAFSFTLRQASSGALPATALVRADYRLPAASRKPLLSKVLVSSLPVVLQEAEPLEQVAKVDVRSGLTTLDEFHGGDVVLVVSNTSAGAIRVTDVRPHPKKGVSFDVEDVPRPLWILPAHQRAIPVAVSLDKGAAPRSGPDVLLFTVGLAWGDKAHARRGSIVIADDVKFGVFAESEVGELLKIPSFLVLPGFLFVLTLALLWRAGAHFKRLPSEPILSNVAAFAYFVVLTSMLLIVVYRIRTGRDIRAGYSFGPLRARPVRSGVSRPFPIPALEVSDRGRPEVADHRVEEARPPGARTGAVRGRDQGGYGSGESVALRESGPRSTSKGGRAQDRGGLHGRRPKA
jgi:hypothetical protein